MLVATTSSLKRWKPGDSQPWNLRRVWHLHRRAGFGETWSQLQRDLRDGPDAAIDRIVAGLGRQTEDLDFEEMSATICDAAVASNNINRLKGWWLYRMLKSPDPLRERLTLAWHNHFATSNIKVQDVGLMRRQNNALRRRATGRFDDLLRAMAHDPALLIWLDADANRKEHPNENLAREIMELFSLGVDHYTEDDVKQAAKALTGWTVKQGQFHNVADRHDSGEKTIFGHRGNWDGDDFVTLLLKHPATPQRVAFRVCELLMGESTRDDSLVQELAAGLAEHHLDIGWAVETLLRSQAFFAEDNLGNRVLSPVELVVGTIRCLEINPLPSTLLLAEVTANLGQDLFNPPNVFGWPGGRTWLSSRAIVSRANFATGLIAGKLHHPSHPLNVGAVAARHGVSRIEQQSAFYCQLLLGHANPPDDLLHDDRLDRFVTSLLASPEAQLA